MNPPQTNSNRDRLDTAVANRLARLRTMPVDLGAIAKAVEREVGPQPEHGGRRKPSWGRWMSPMRLTAASVLVFGLVAALVIGTSSGPALASTARLAAMHDNVQKHGGVHACHVDSIAEANTALASKSPGAPALPDVPTDHVHFCCIQNLGRKPVSCAAVIVDGQPVTLAVAEARNIRVDLGKPRVIRGHEFFISSQGDLNMVMTEQSGKWICVMGRVPVPRLIDTAVAVKP